MTRTEKHKPKREALKKECADFDNYLDKLERENDYLKTRVGELLQKIQVLETDISILEIKCETLRAL